VQNGDESRERRNEWNGRRLYDQDEDEKIYDGGSGKNLQCRWNQGREEEKEGEISLFQVAWFWGRLLREESQALFEVFRCGEKGVFKVYTERSMIIGRSGGREDSHLVPEDSDAAWDP